jgi:hypothetical protein
MDGSVPDISRSLTSSTDKRVMEARSLSSVLANHILEADSNNEVGRGKLNMTSP